MIMNSPFKIDFSSASILALTSQLASTDISYEVAVHSFPNFLVESHSEPPPREILLNL
jgi:hypothetical protein